jgi:hypothetical protein
VKVMRRRLARWLADDLERELARRQRRRAAIAEYVHVYVRVRGVQDVSQLADQLSRRGRHG